MYDLYESMVFIILAIELSTQFFGDCGATILTASLAIYRYLKRRITAAHDPIDICGDSAENKNLTEDYKDNELSAEIDELVVLKEIEDEILELVKNPGKNAEEEFKRISNKLYAVKANNNKEIRTKKKSLLANLEELQPKLIDFIDDLNNKEIADQIQDEEIEETLKTSNNSTEENDDLNRTAEFITKRILTKESTEKNDEALKEDEASNENLDESAAKNVSNEEDLQRKPETNFEKSEPTSDDASILKGEILTEENFEESAPKKDPGANFEPTKEFTPTVSKETEQVCNKQEIAARKCDEKAAEMCTDDLTDSIFDNPDKTEPKAEENVLKMAEIERKIQNLEDRIANCFEMGENFENHILKCIDELDQLKTNNKPELQEAKRNALTKLEDMLEE